MLPGGPAPEMPQAPQPDPSQMPPTDPSQAPAGAPQQITEQEKQALLSSIATIQQKLGHFNAIKFASDNKTENIRRELLKQVFEKLQMSGVDLTSQQSVAQFLAALQQQNPELAANFEKAMEALLGGQGAPTAPQDPTQSMDLGVPSQDTNAQAPDPNAQPQIMNNENPNDQQQNQALPQG